MDSYVSSEHHLFRPLHNLLPSVDMGRMNCEQGSRSVNTFLRVMQRCFLRLAYTIQNRPQSENNAAITAKLNVILPEVIRFEVFMAVTMKNGVFWEVKPCFSCKNRLGTSSQRASVASYS
jgi:hypothetical protein